MNRNLLIKLGAIAALMLLLMIPILMIDGMVEERQALRDGVLEDIARSSSYSQKITGPLLVAPYRKTVREWKTHEKTGQRYLEESEVSGRLYFLPERLAVGSEISTELRARGIYQARLFHSNSRLTGHFQVPANFGVTEDIGDYTFSEPFISVGISDIRGIKNNLVLEQGERKLPFQPGSADSMLGAGVHAPLPMAVADVHQGQRLDFAFDLLLQGTGELSIAPVGRGPSRAKGPILRGRSPGSA